MTMVVELFKLVAALGAELKRPSGSGRLVQFQNDEQPSNLIFFYEFFGLILIPSQSLGPDTGWGRPSFAHRGGIQMAVGSFQLPHYFCNSVLRTPTPPIRKVLFGK